MGGKRKKSLKLQNFPGQVHPNLSETGTMLRPSGPPSEEDTVASPSGRGHGAGAGAEERASGAGVPRVPLLG